MGSVGLLICSLPVSPDSSFATFFLSDSTPAALVLFLSSPELISISNSFASVCLVRESLFPDVCFLSLFS